MKSDRESKVFTNPEGKPFAPWVTSDGELLQGSVRGLEDTRYVVLTMKSEASHIVDDPKIAATQEASGILPQLIQRHRVCTRYSGLSCDAFAGAVTSVRPFSV